MRANLKVPQFLKIERYAQRLTQRYMGDGGSGWWAPEPIENDHRPPCRGQRKVAISESAERCLLSVFYAYCSMTIRNTFKIYQHSVNKNSRLPRKGGSKLGIGEHLGDDGKCEKTHLYPIPGVPRVLPLFLFPQSLNYRTYMSIGIDHRKGSW